MPDNISLDFANTAGWHAGPSPEEHLTSYRVALAWAVREGILGSAQEEALLAAAEAGPEKEATALRRIVEFREAIYRIFSAVSHAGEPDGADIALLNAELADACGHLRLVSQDGGGFGWEWTGMEDSLTSLLWPVARDAALVLTSAQLPKLRECAGEACGWLFLDLTKNASRRWCDMADCGNRAKARRYRERKRAIN